MADADLTRDAFLGGKLHLWQPAHGLVSHTSYIGAYPGPYPFF